MQVSPLGPGIPAELGTIGLQSNRRINTMQEIPKRKQKKKETFMIHLHLNLSD